MLLKHDFYCSTNRLSSEVEVTKSWLCGQWTNNYYHNLWNVAMLIIHVCVCETLSHGHSIIQNRNYRSILWYGFDVHDLAHFQSPTWYHAYLELFECDNLSWVFRTQCITCVCRAMHQLTQWYKIDTHFRSILAKMPNIISFRLPLKSKRVTEVDAVDISR